MRGLTPQNAGHPDGARSHPRRRRAGICRSSGCKPSRARRRGTVWARRHFGVGGAGLSPTPNKTLFQIRRLAIRGVRCPSRTTPKRVGRSTTTGASCMTGGSGRRRRREGRAPSSQARSAWKPWIEVVTERTRGPRRVRFAGLPCARSYRAWESARSPVSPSRRSSASVVPRGPSAGVLERVPSPTLLSPRQSHRDLPRHRCRIRQGFFPHASAHSRLRSGNPAPRLTCCEQDCKAGTGGSRGTAMREAAIRYKSG